MLKEIRELGFDLVELSHGIRVTLVPGILQAVEEGLVSISSVHNFCPLPIGVYGAAPNIYQPSSDSERERSMWRRNTLKTIEFARNVQARVVVIHAGSVRFRFRNPQKKLAKYVGEAGYREASMKDDYGFLLESCLEKVRRQRLPAMNRLEESLEQLAEPARQAGLRIGIENREGFLELPLDAEISGLLSRLGHDDVFGYWHDTGHAQLKDLMGVLPHSVLLGENRDRLIGFHVHDVTTEERDHAVPGTGTIAWDMIREEIQPHHSLVLELSPKLDSDHVIEAKSFMENLLGP